MTHVLVAAALLSAAGSPNCYRGPELHRPFVLEPGQMVSHTQAVYAEGGKQWTVREDIRYQGQEGRDYWFLVITSSELEGFAPLSMIKVAVDAEGETRYLGRHTKLAVQIEPATGRNYPALRVLSHAYERCESGNEPKQKQVGSRQP